MSLVLGKDVIPRSVCWMVGQWVGVVENTVSTEPQSHLLLNRLSVTNLEDLKKRILRVIAHCNKPKVIWTPVLGGSAGRGCMELRRCLNSTSGRAVALNSATAL